jgi:hypothetical protein
MAILSVILYLAVAGVTDCGQAASSGNHIQWSESAVMPAPGRLAQVEVHPILNADENASPVLLRFCPQGRTHHLLTLERSADVYWGTDSHALLVINQPGADQYKVSVVKIREKNGDVVENVLDNGILAHVPMIKDHDRHVVFYLPRFVSWTSRTLVLSIGGATAAKGNGPMSSYCYGVAIDSQTLEISEWISADDLKTKFGAECQLAP